MTGPVGSGKSAVCDVLREKGFPVYDSDSEAKKLYGTVPGLKKRIETVLGIPFGELGRIFGDKALRDKLEALVYPFVLADFEKWVSGTDSSVAFMESAVALEKPMFRGVFDEVWLVTAPYSTRVTRHPRVAERNDIQTFDGSMADIVIENDGTIDELKNRINELV